MKNITKLISALIFCALLGSYTLKAQSCTVVFTPNAVTEGNLFVDDIIQFSTATHTCNTAGHINKIVIKYHNSFYNNNSPSLKDMKLYIKQSDNSVITLMPAQDSAVKGSIISGPAQTYTATLTFAGNLPQYFPTDQYLEIKAIAYAGTTTGMVNNWIDEVDIFTAP